MNWSLKCSNNVIEMFLGWMTKKLGILKRKKVLTLFSSYHNGGQNLGLQVTRCQLWHVTCHVHIFFLRKIGANILPFKTKVNPRHTGLGLNAHSHSQVWMLTHILKIFLNSLGVLGHGLEFLVFYLALFVWVCARARERMSIKYKFKIKELSQLSPWSGSQVW